VLPTAPAPTIAILVELFLFVNLFASKQSKWLFGGIKFIRKTLFLSSNHQLLAGAVTLLEFAESCF
jgi:hypothetical protein